MTTEDQMPDIEALMEEVLRCARVRNLAVREQNGANELHEMQVRRLGNGPVMDAETCEMLSESFLAQKRTQERTAMVSAELNVAIDRWLFAIDGKV